MVVVEGVGGRGRQLMFEDHQLLWLEAGGLFWVGRLLLDVDSLPLVSRSWLVSLGGRWLLGSEGFSLLMWDTAWQVM